MKISILCTNLSHPVFPHLVRWVSVRSKNNEIELVDNKKRLSGGDLLFLISCNELIDKNIRALYQSTLVIHASDLPNGRGWSPQVWQILEGKSRITVTLLEAEEAVDSGAVWTKISFDLEGHELWDEINDRLFAVELQLMDFAVDNFGTIKPVPQEQIKTSHYQKRIPGDSRLDPDKTISQQFELLRVCDPERFPAFFEYRGYKYKIILQKCEDQEVDN